MREIPVYPNASAVVVDEDYLLLSRHGWRLAFDGRYAITGLGTVSVAMHRLVFGEVPARHQLDHVNGDGLDNRRTNLRVCTPQQNQANRRKVATAKPLTSRRLTSKYKGVSFDPGPTQFRRPWRARVTVAGRQLLLGRFATEEEAARAYDEAARREFGEFAFLNFSVAA